MNDNLNTPTPSNLPPILAKKPGKFTKVSVPVEKTLYEEIKALLPELSDQIGSKITMPAFCRKTILENWRVQIERYRKLSPSAKPSRS